MVVYYAATSDSSSAYGVIDIEFTYDPDDACKPLNIRSNMELITASEFTKLTSPSVVRKLSVVKGLFRVVRVRIDPVGPPTKYARICFIPHAGIDYVPLVGDNIDLAIKKLMREREHFSTLPNVRETLFVVEGELGYFKVLKNLERDTLNRSHVFCLKATPRNMYTIDTFEEVDDCHELMELV